MYFRVYMCMCICVCVHVYVHLCACVCISVRACACHGLTSGEWILFANSRIQELEAKVISLAPDRVHTATDTNIRTHTGHGFWYQAVTNAPL